MKKYFALLFVLILFLGFSAYSYVSAISKDLCNNVFRLHVIANSDSKEDQDLKYKVRDSLIEYMKSLTSNIDTKEEAILIAQNHIDDFKQLAKKVITDNGYNYNVNIEIGNFSFPTKTYGDISLPAGLYDALKVVIGDGEGQNWWCVMFPPLCFVDVSSGVVPEESKENLSENLNDEEFNLISNTDDSSIVNFKFKVVEFFESIGIKVANN